MIGKIKTYRDEDPYLTLNIAREIFHKALNELDFKKIAKECGFPETASVLVMLASRISEICESIISIKSYYSSVILYRALGEHAIKHAYISVRSRTNDDVAMKYFSILANEELSKIKGAKWPNSLEINKEFKDSTEKIYRDFSLKVILEYFKNDDESVDFLNLLRGIMVKYSESSSYIHGGPTAVMNPQDKDIKAIRKDAVITVISSYFFTMTRFSLFNPECQQRLEKFNREIKEIMDDIREKWFPCEIENGHGKQSMTDKE